jgi:hypothetical protein
MLPAPCRGWAQSGVSMRLAGSCCLHRITSSDVSKYDVRAYHPSTGGPFPAYRTTYSRLGPPKDAIELGERIHAWWHVYRVDRSASIGSGWPVGMADEMIETPFPRPLEEYANVSSLFAYVTVLIMKTRLTACTVLFPAQLDLDARPDRYLSDLFSTEPVRPGDLSLNLDGTLMQAVGQSSSHLPRLRQLSPVN